MQHTECIPINITVMTNIDFYHYNEITRIIEFIFIDNPTIK